MLKFDNGRSKGEGMRRLISLLVCFCVVKISFEASNQSPTKLIARGLNNTNDESIISLKTWLEFLPNDEYTINFNATLHVEVKNFFVHFGVYTQNSNGKYEPFIKNVTVDVCKFLKNQRGNKLMQVFYNSGFKNRKFPDGCPIKPQFFFLDGLKLDENILKVKLFEAKFLIVTDYCTKIDKVKFLKNQRGNKLLKLFYNSGFKNRNFPEGCPIKPQFFFVDGLKFDENIVKLNVFETKLLVVIDYCTKIDKVKYYAMKTYFAVDLVDREKYELEKEKERKLLNKKKRKETNG
ncbi:CLUMA_CG001230, isoform A [Clunio marinus]|uniref:CLUMA_CG001230, isoform A n=1 Tax=Clunio marinus TaxID=568069 RepID=A0A1J1HJ37_9DIPT|nr:CLUMA_CG001230, isoform A [Clunio marinus]